MNYLRNSVFVLLVLLSFGTVSYGDDYQQAIGLIHMDSEVSGGENTVAMLGAVARNAGADVAIVTDHDTQKATYGIWPLRKILRVSHARASIRNYGILNYLEEVRLTDEDLDDFTYIPGIEAVPYYSWEKSSFSNSPMIANLHRHILVIGMEGPEQIENLPSIEAGYPREYTTGSLLKLLWILPLLISFFLFKPPDSRSTHQQGWFKALFSEEINYLSIPLLVVSVIFLFDAYPFNEPVVDQYPPNDGIKPYQIFIDYVNEQGGMTFWAHPEAMYDETISTEKGNPIVTAALRSVLSEGLEIKTEPYYHLLNSTRDYTGFAIFFEGYKVVGRPEGVWDSTLLQFCRGDRERPIWAISEIDMEEGTDPETASESQTVFLVKDKTKADYLDALKKGRVHCFSLNLTKWVTINDFSVQSDGLNAISGEVLPYAGSAEMNLDIDIRKQDLELTAVVINNGRAIYTEKLNGSRKLSVKLGEPLDRMGYVRVVFYIGTEMRIATNPIFYLNTLSTSTSVDAL